MSIKYKIAEIPLLMEPKFSPLLPQSEAYRCEEDIRPRWDLRLSAEHFASCREKFPTASDSLIEYMETGSLFYYALLMESGLLLHSSAVCMEGKAYLFSAPSGTGKSTHTALWKRVYGERAEILNDDKPAIRILEDGIFAYGTPWSGKSDLNLNRKVPLQAICFLERGAENSISPLPKEEAILKLLQQTLRPKEPRRAANLLDLLDRLVTQIPFYRLACRPDEQAAILAYEFMSKGE